MKKIVIAAVMMIVSLGSANAFVNGDSTLVASARQNNLPQYTFADANDTSVDYFQSSTSENTITVNQVSNRVIEVITNVGSKNEMEISITDLEGTTVYEGKTNGYFSTIMLEEVIQPGIYMVQIDAGNVQKTKRLVIR